MELVPEIIEGAVVFNVRNSCQGNQDICGNCGDFAVGVHNWLLSSDEVRYVIVDLQDEKVICQPFLEELLLLRRRLKVPFVFVGVMERPRKVLEAFDYFTSASTYVTPEDAIAALKQEHPHLFETSLDKVKIGSPVAVSRPRQPVTADESAEPESEGEADSAE